MYVNAHIKVFINGTQVYSIVEVEAENDSHNVGATCDIVMPLNARIEFNGQNTTGVDTKNINKGYLTEVTRYSFNTGDHIKIYAKYEGYESDPNAESVPGLDENDKYLLIFEGFLYEFHLGTPIKIKCLDYIYWFNLGYFGDVKIDLIAHSKSGKFLPKKSRSGIGVQYKGNVQFKKIMQDLLQWVNANITQWNDDNGTNFLPVTLNEKTFDTPLVDITFLSMSPASVLEYFKREIGLCITLMGSELYVNVASNTTKEVKLDTGINVIKSDIQTNNLKNANTAHAIGANSIFLKIKLVAYFILDNGKKASITIGDENGEVVNNFFYNVKPDTATTMRAGVAVPNNMLTLANEALIKAVQGRFKGQVETLLYPNYDLFWKVIYKDRRYKEKNGNYVVTSLKIKISEHGYHRTAKLAWLDDQN
jgi:hypothetical protein